MVDLRNMMYIRMLDTSRLEDIVDALLQFEYVEYEFMEEIIAERLTEPIYQRSIWRVFSLVTFSLLMTTLKNWTYRKYYN